jgi:5-formyltetrahydrofolate cyclo-ligase
MLKTALRKIYAAKRNAVTPEDMIAFEQHATEQLKLLFKNKVIDCMATYYPIKKFNEPNAYNIVQNSISHKSTIICLPKMLDNNTMHFYATDRNTIWQTNAWNIVEPEPIHIIPAQQINVMIVPLLCFNNKGYRVGYGKGFYDNYLNHYKHNITTIGLSCFEAVSNISDIHKNDVPLNYVITPQQLYEC